MRRDEFEVEANRQGRSEAKLVFGREETDHGEYHVCVNMLSIHIKVYEVYGIMVFKER